MHNYSLLVFLGLLLLGLQVFFPCHLRLSTHYYYTCNRSVNCFVDKHPFQTSLSTSPSLLYHSIVLSSLGLTSVLLHSNTTFHVHLTPVMWAFFHHNSLLRIPYIGILFTLIRITNRRLTLTRLREFQITPTLQTVWSLRTLLKTKL